VDIHRGSKNKKMLAAAAAATAVASSSQATVVADTARLLPVLQPVAYSSVEGYIFLLVPVLAGCGDRIRFPAKFVETMEGQKMAHAIVQAGSAG
jgi:hypothetical protein